LLSGARPEKRARFVELITRSRKVRAVFVSYEWAGVVAKYDLRFAPRLNGKEALLIVKRGPFGMQWLSDVGFAVE
jgi:hypothetical protein